MSLTIAVTEPDEDVTIAVRDSLLVTIISRAATEETVNIAVRYRGIVKAYEITENTSPFRFATEGLITPGQGPDAGNEIPITSVTLTGVDNGGAFGGRPDDDFRVDLNNVRVFDEKRNVTQYLDPWSYTFGSGEVSGGDVIDVFLFNGWGDGSTVPVEVVVTWEDEFTDSFQVYQDLLITGEVPLPSPIPPGYFTGDPVFEQYSVMDSFPVPYRIRTTYMVNEGTRITTVRLDDPDADD